jgi:C-terminal processing protease CtpA/Prc
MIRIILCSLSIIFFCFGTCCAGNSEKNFGGIGIDGIPWADGRIVVKQLVAGGPAQLAGIQVGDIITHIDGKATEGSDFRQMVDYRLRGKAGTKVLLRVRRPGSSKSLTFNITRRQLVLKGATTKQSENPE